MALNSKMLIDPLKFLSKIRNASEIDKLLSFKKLHKVISS